MNKREHWPISGLNLTVSRIEILGLKKELLGTATGFFFKIGENKKYFVTNRHVVINEADNFFPQFLKLSLHNSITNYASSYQVDLKLEENGKPLWKDHTDYENNSADVVVIPLNQKTLILENMKNFYSSRINFLSPKNFLPDDTELSSFADVIIVGYPLGFQDYRNNLPVYRKGMIASSYPVNFNGKPYFLIDANLHPGTSGSPVFNSSVNLLKNGTGAFHSSQAIFLGIHSAEHIVNEEPLGLAVVWYPTVITDIIKAFDS